MASNREHNALPDGLGEYLLERQAQRQRRARGIFGSLRLRDQRLVREAAVMGYVLGSMGGRTSENFPTDAEIVQAVLLSIDNEPAPHYPTIRRACRRADRLGLTA